MIDLKKIKDYSYLEIILGILVAVFLTVDFSADSIGSSEKAELLIDKLLPRFSNFGTVNMAISIPIIFLFLYAKKNTQDIKGIWGKTLIATSIVFGAMNAFGQQMYYVDRLPATGFESVIMWLYAASCSVLFYYTALAIHSIIPSFIGEKAGSKGDEKNDRRMLLVIFLIILAGWLPWIISYYPGSADWDVYYPICQYMKYTSRNNQHPWFYSVTVGGCYKFGLQRGSKNLGMFLYIVIRDLIMAYIYASTIVKLKKTVLYLVTAFYAVVPVWGAYAKHAFKDTLGAALFCIFMVCCVEAALYIEKNGTELNTYIKYSVAALFMALYRNNLYYVALVITIIFVVLVAKNKEIGKHRVLIIISLIMMVVGYKGYNAGVQKFDGVQPGPVVEALSIPLQQTARTVRDHGNEITEEEAGVIGKVLDYSAIVEKYDPLLSDPIKWIWKGEDSEKVDYMITWGKMFFKYPLTYFEAALGQSYGYYAFTPDQVPGAGNSNCGMTIFNWTKDDRFNESVTCDYVESMDRIRVVLDHWAKLWHELPLLGLTDVKAIYTWLIVIVGIYLIKKDRKMMLIPILGYLLMILTCCASPVNDCFRYFSPVAAAAPVLFLIISI